MIQNEQDIARFIVETIKNSPAPLLGAQLGWKLKTRFPGINFREHGNLKSFIQQRCGNEVVFLRKHGMDDVWGRGNGEQLSQFIPPVSRLSDERSTKVTPTSSSQGLSGLGTSLNRSLSAWKAFTHPTAPGKLAVNVWDADVKVVACDESVTPPFAQIPRVTKDENRQIAKEFLDFFEYADRPGFEAISSLPEFWETWFREIRDFKHGRYSGQWAKFRFNKLCNLFADRLQGLGASSECIAACVEKLKGLKSESQGFKRSTFSSDGVKTTPDIEQPPRASGTVTREVVIEVIDRMAEEDLKRLWLPFGAVIDALRKH
jgi:hypothetical protein